MYSILTGFGFGLWALFRDGTQHYFEREADEALANMGAEVSSAGVRFYEKLLAKNISIRGLSGDKSVYTAKGNLTFLFRNPHVPLTERKSFFEKKLKELEEEQQQKGEDKMGDEEKKTWELVERNAFTKIKCIEKVPLGFKRERYLIN